MRHTTLRSSFQFRLTHLVENLNNVLIKNPSQMHLTSLQWAEWSLITWSFRILGSNFETPYFQVDLSLIEKQFKTLEQQLDLFRTSILTDLQQKKVYKFLYDPTLNENSKTKNE